MRHVEALSSRNLASSVRESQVLAASAVTQACLRRRAPRATITRAARGASSSAITFDDAKRRRRAGADPDRQACRRFVTTHPRSRGARHKRCTLSAARHATDASDERHVSRVELVPARRVSAAGLDALQARLVQGARQERVGSGRARPQILPRGDELEDARVREAFRQDSSPDVSFPCACMSARSDGEARASAVPGRRGATDDADLGRV